MMLLLSITVLAAGCATYRAYPGARLPREEIAILSVPPTVMSVDGEAIRKDNVGTIELLPGWHSIKWEFTYPNGFRTTESLSFEAEAGERYRLGERFFPPPNPLGPVGDLLGFVIDVAWMPLDILLPFEPPAEAPDGSYYSWITHCPSQTVVAGLAPAVPQGDCVITFVPLDGQDAAGR
jgi:hypothetical protein